MNKSKFRMTIKLYIDSNVFNLMKLENIRAFDIIKYDMIFKKSKRIFQKIRMVLKT